MYVFGDIDLLSKARTSEIFERPDLSQPHTQKHPDNCKKRETNLVTKDMIYLREKKSITYMSFRDLRKTLSVPARIQDKRGMLKKKTQHSHYNNGGNQDY